MNSTIANVPQLLLGLSLIGVFAISALITLFVRRYSIKHSLMDIPNARSSHSTPTPRGGGFSISLLTLIAICFMGYTSLLPLNVVIAMGGGGLLVTVIGWMDDHYDIATVWRAISYLFAAIWFLYWLDGTGMITLGTIEIKSSIFVNILCAFGMAWLINLYNFMDGTDALASVQAICTGMMAALLFLISGHDGLANISLVLIFASGGFLLWNWPPAKIFMGDVSSCMLGFIFAALAISGNKLADVPILVWFILLSVFIVDTTLTLIKRFFIGEKWYAAHHSHAYQRLIQLGMSHLQLVLGVLAVNVFLLWPAAYLVYHWREYALALTLVIYILNFGLWFIIQLRYHRLNIENTT